MSMSFHSYSNKLVLLKKVGTHVHRVLYFELNVCPIFVASFSMHMWVVLK